MRILNAKFGWRRNIPRDLNLTAKERRSIGRMHMRLRLVTLARMLLVFLAGLGLFYAWRFHFELMLFGRRRYGFAAVIPMVLAVLIPCVTAMWILRVDYARAVRSSLRKLGHDVCIKCGYLLRGLSDDVKQCPECGAERETMYGELDGE